MHALKRPTSKIHRRRYPNIFKALDDIIVDNVASSALTKRIKRKLYSGYTIGNILEINPSIVEHFISKLSEEQRQVMTMGDQDEALELFGKRQGFSDANKLLNEFFNTL